MKTGPDLLALRAIRDCGAILATTPKASERFDRLCGMGLAWGYDIVRGRVYRLTGAGEALALRVRRLA